MIHLFCYLIFISVILCKLDSHCNCPHVPYRQKGWCSVNIFDYIQGCIFQIFVRFLAVLSEVMLFSPQCLQYNSRTLPSMSVMSAFFQFPIYIHLDEHHAFTIIVI